MRQLLLVAREEFIKYVTRRGFLISIFMMPAWIAIAALVPSWLAHHAPARSFVLIDRAGGYAPDIARAVAARAAQDAQEARAAYAQSHGGDLRGFVAPPPRIAERPVPAALSTANGQGFAAKAAAILGTPQAPDAIVVIPPDFGTSHVAQVWSTGPGKPELNGFLKQQLTDSLRRQTLARIAPTASLEALEVSAELNTRDPSRAAGRQGSSLVQTVEHASPSILAFLLVLTILMNAASLMSAVIEEKSSRIVEVMLSCVTPWQFMTGKLIAAAGAALLTLALWVGGAVAAGIYFLPQGHALVGAVVAALATGPFVAVLFLCFGCGLLLYCSIFLAIGSMTASVQDAQAYVGPVMLATMAPMILLPTLMHDPNGTIATALTWIPVYTPFFLMFRMPWHPPVVQVWLAVGLMLVTTAAMVWLMGRVFAAHVLTSERPPQLGAAIRRALGISGKDKPARVDRPRLG